METCEINLDDKIEGYKRTQEHHQPTGSNQHLYGILPNSNRTHMLFEFPWIIYQERHNL